MWHYKAEWSFQANVSIAVLQSTVVIPSQCQQCDITQQTGDSKRKWEHCSITKKSGGLLNQHPQSGITKHTGSSTASLESVVLQSRNMVP
jgi:hypothetical protein